MGQVVLASTSRILVRRCSSARNATCISLRYSMAPGQKWGALPEGEVVFGIGAADIHDLRLAEHRRVPVARRMAQHQQRTGGYRYPADPVSRVTTTRHNNPPRGFQPQDLLHRIVDDCGVVQQYLQLVRQLDQ